MKKIFLLFTLSFGFWANVVFADDPKINLYAVKNVLKECVKNQSHDWCNIDIDKLVIDINKFKGITLSRLKDLCEQATVGQNNCYAFVSEVVKEHNSFVDNGKILVKAAVNPDDISSKAVFAVFRNKEGECEKIVFDKSFADFAEEASCNDIISNEWKVELGNATTIIGESSCASGDFIEGLPSCYCRIKSGNPVAKWTPLRAMGVKIDKYKDMGITDAKTAKDNCLNYCSYGCAVAVGGIKGEKERLLELKGVE